MRLRILLKRLTLSGNTIFYYKIYNYDNTSAIVGSVIIEKCVQNHPSVWAEKGVWNWVLKDAEFFHHPIKDVKGKLGFWDY